MAEEMQVHIPRVKLGGQGLEVSQLGFGCMGLTGLYNSPLSDEDGISIIKYAFSLIQLIRMDPIMLMKFWLASNFHGKKIQLATKFGIAKVDLQNNQVLIKGTPEYVRSSCEASLKRLDVEYIDLYYQHRVDTSVPIEETMGELKKLVEEGKIKYIGLSEASADTIRRAHAVHPVTALQMEWSLWTREIEEEIIPLCRELGIGVVPYSPLGRGFFGGKGVLESLPADSQLGSYPRFQKGNLEKNREIYTRMEKLAIKHECTPVQLALAWVLQQGDDVVPIPGTTKTKNLDDNVGYLRVKLTEEDLKEISDAVPISEVAGGRSYVGTNHLLWKFANTPAKGYKVSA